jgi:hypothetical protein
MLSFSLYTLVIGFPFRYFLENKTAPLVLAVQLYSLSFFHSKAGNPLKIISLIAKAFPDP